MTTDRPGIGAVLAAIESATAKIGRCKSGHTNIDVLDSIYVEELDKIMRAYAYAQTLAEPRRNPNDDAEKAMIEKALAGRPYADALACAVKWRDALKLASVDEDEFVSKLDAECTKLCNGDAVAGDALAARAIWEGWQC